MPKLICEEIPDDSSDLAHLRRIKTIWIYRAPEVDSKGLAKVTVVKDGEKFSDVFAIDSEGSNKRILKAHRKHLKSLGSKNEDEVEVEIVAASAEDYVAWLKDNEDPERKAFGLLLETSLAAEKRAQMASETALDASNAAKGAAEQLAEALRRAQDAYNRADEILAQARLSEENAKNDRAKGTIYAIAAFIAGSLLDVGMLQEKSHFRFPACWSSHSEF